MIEHTRKTLHDSSCSIPAAAESSVAGQYRNPACEHQPHGGVLRDQRLFWRRVEKETTVSEAAWKCYRYRIQWSAHGTRAAQTQRLRQAVER